VRSSVSLRCFAADAVSVAVDVAMPELDVQIVPGDLELLRNVNTLEDLPV
jgi:hypothetical protein